MWMVNFGDFFLTDFDVCNIVLSSGHGSFWGHSQDWEGAMRLDDISFDFTLEMLNIMIFFHGKKKVVFY